MLAAGDQEAYVEYLMNLSEQEWNGEKAPIIRRNTKLLKEAGVLPA
jgi:hypothetical protein